MTEPKPRATAHVDVVAKGKASIVITREDGSPTVGGQITREADHRYRVEDDDGHPVATVQQYSRASRALARHYGILPRYTLATKVTHPRDRA